MEDLLMRALAFRISHGPSKTEFLSPCSLGNDREGTLSEAPAGLTSGGRASSDDWPSCRARRFFAASAALLMLLVAFAGTAREARAEAAHPLVALSVTYGPGWERVVNADGRVEMHQLPTFQRWDGVWQSVSSLNR